MKKKEGKVFENMKEYTGKELLEKVKIQGRAKADEKGIHAVWSCAGIEFIAECEGRVTLTISPTALSVTEGNGGCFFTVILDGKPLAGDLRRPEEVNAEKWTENSAGYPFCFFDLSEKTYTLAEDLPRGKHTFGIYKQTEAADGAYLIRGIGVNGRLLDPPAEKEHFIEFVGDSIVACMGNLCSGPGRTALYQDATSGWAFYTAKVLDADFSLVARSGITATDGIGWNGTESVSMQTVYPLLSYFSDKQTPCAFSRTPRAVVVCLGTNDMSTYESSGAALENVKAGFEQMTALLRKKNPGARLVWVLFEGSRTSPCIEELFDRLGGEEQGCYRLYIKPNSQGGVGHPCLSVQRAYAEGLTALLRRIL